MKRRRWFFLGTGLLAALWFGPLPAMARDAFAAHMALHMGLVAVVAPLLALGLAGGRFDPVRAAPGWFPPVPWSLAELVVVWAWHAPALHHWARQGALGFCVEQASFLGAGLAVWLSAFGGAVTPVSSRAGAGIAALLLTSMHMTLLGALLALTPRALYAHGPDAHGMSSLGDQHLGGAIMLLVGGVAYLVGGLWLTTGLVRGARLARPKAERTA